MNKTKEEETYIGNLKFFDSVVNNFGFVGSVRNSNEVIKDDVHIERKDLLHEPELYNDNMLVFLKILEGDRGLKGYDVSLLNKHSLKEIIPFFPLLDRSLFEEFSGLEYKAERIECVAILEKKIKSEINESLKEDLCKALKQMPHEYHDLIADVDSEEFLNLVKSKEILPPNYLLKLSKIDPDGFLSAIKSKVDYMSDVEKWAFIKESKSKKVAKKLLDSWKFENSYFPSGFVGLLQGENLSKKNIPNFYKNMNKSILKEEGYSQISSLREVKDIISINNLDYLCFLVQR